MVRVWRRLKLLKTKVNFVKTFLNYLKGFKILVKCQTWVGLEFKIGLQAKFKLDFFLVFGNLNYNLGPYMDSSSNSSYFLGFSRLLNYFWDKKNSIAPISIKKPCLDPSSKPVFFLSCGVALLLLTLKISWHPPKQEKTQAWTWVFWTYWGYQATLDIKSNSTTPKNKKKFKPQKVTL